MFLTELHAFYQRMIQAPGSGIAPPGYSEENIGFVLRITPQGELKAALSLLTDKGKARKMQVPSWGQKRTVGIAPNFLWDNTGYVLGVDGKGNPERTMKTFAAFRALHQEAAARTQAPQLQAVTAFLENWVPDRFFDLPGHEDLIGKNCVFQIEGGESYAHEQEEARQAWAQMRKRAQEGVRGRCLITGEEGVIAATHPPIKGVRGAQTSGAALVSFNCEAFTSYGKAQSRNAPVSEEAALAYATALNYLLQAKNRHSLHLGDMTVVFWAARPGPAEDMGAALLGFEDGVEEAGTDQAGEGDQETHARVRAALDALRNGQPLEAVLPKEVALEPFYILGLAPNQARISVRFWLVSRFGKLMERVGRHYADLAIQRSQPDKEPEFPALWRLLRETAVQGKTENIPKGLAGAVALRIFSGAPYPATLYAALLERIRADKHVNYLRAAMLKAYCIRNYKMNYNKGRIAMALDTARHDVPYLLGRLFSLLEKNQRDALGNTLNATIRDKYIGSASATPRRVFPQLLRLAQHHSTKSDYGDRMQKRIAEVVDHIPDFPATLPLEQQGSFFIGYYQQQIANYTSTREKE